MKVITLDTLAEVAERSRYERTNLDWVHEARALQEQYPNLRITFGGYGGTFSECRTALFHVSRVNRNGSAYWTCEVRVPMANAYSVEDVEADYGGIADHSLLGAIHKLVQLD